MSDKMREAKNALDRLFNGAVLQGYPQKTAEYLREEIEAALTQQPESGPVGYVSGADIDRQEQMSACKRFVESRRKGAESGPLGYVSDIGVNDIKLGHNATINGSCDFPYTVPVYIDAEPSAQVPGRIQELAERLVSTGPKCCAVSASECHEISDFIRDLSDTPSIAEKREPSHYVVLDEEGQIQFSVAVKDPISANHAKSMMHEHINDAINGGMEGANTWVVRVVTGLERPKPPEPQP